MRLCLKRKQKMHTFTREKHGKAWVFFFTLKHLLRKIVRDTEDHLAVPLPLSFPQLLVAWSCAGAQCRSHCWAAWACCPHRELAVKHLPPASSLIFLLFSSSFSHQTMAHTVDLAHFVLKNPKLYKEANSTGKLSQHVLCSYSRLILYKQNIQHWCTDSPFCAPLGWFMSAPSAGTLKAGLQSQKPPQPGLLTQLPHSAWLGWPPFLSLGHHCPFHCSREHSHCGQSRLGVTLRT